MPATISATEESAIDVVPTLPLAPQQPAPEWILQFKQPAAIFAPRILPGFSTKLIWKGQKRAGE